MDFGMFRLIGDGDRAAFPREPLMLVSDPHRRRGLTLFPPA